ncbi:MAG TPA: CopD family protein [Kofleriaceae bacterium]|jgi:uncharacterized membrane protein
MLHPLSWLMAGHIIGILLWVGGLMSVYWIQRVQSHAPNDARDQLTAMQRSLALMTDLAAALAIGCGIAMIVSPANMLTMPHMGWLHTKLTLVVIGILPVHGMIRARVKKFSRGENPAVPQWQWSLLLAAVVAIVILVVMRPF